MNADEAVLVFIDEYSRNAEAYEANVVPRFAPLAEALVKRADLKPHMTVLDVSTGTGLTALLAAKALGGNGLVVGIDLADGALAVAQTKAARSGLRNVRLEMLDSRNIVYRSGTFDAALCSFGLSSVGHEQILREIHRVLKESAWFHLLSWGPPGPGGGAARDVLAAHRTTSPSKEAAIVRDADSVIQEIAKEASLTDASVLTAKLRAAGFSEVRAEARSESVEFGGIDAYLDWWRGFGDFERELREMDAASLVRFRAELEEKLRELSRDNTYAVPWNVVYYDARK